MSVDKKLLSILIFSLGLGIIFIFIMDNYFTGGDVFKRLYISYRMAELGHWLVYEAWQPLHFWLIAILYKIINHIELAGRLVSLISFLFLQYAFFKRNELLGNSGLLGGIFLVINAYIVMMATLTYSEILYVSLIFGGLYYIDLFFKKDHKQILVYSGILFAMSNLVRSEAWLISCAFLPYLLYKKVPIKKIALFAVIIISPIVFYSIQDYIAHNEFWFFYFNSNRVASHGAANFENLAFLTIAIRESFNMTIVSFGIISLFFRFKHKHLHFFDGIMLFIFLFIAYKMLTKTLLSNPRYLLLSYIWLAGSSLYIFRYIKEWKFRKTFISILFILIIISDSRTAYHLYHRMHYSDSYYNSFKSEFTHHQKDLLKFIDKNVRGKTFALDREDRAFEMAIMYKLDLSFQNMLCWDVKYYWKVNVNEVGKKCLEEVKPDYIIAFPKRDIGGHLSQYIDTIDMEALGYQLVYANRGYRVFYFSPQ